MHRTLRHEGEAAAGGGPGGGAWCDRAEAGLVGDSGVMAGRGDLTVDHDTTLVIGSDVFWSTRPVTEATQARDSEAPAHATALQAHRNKGQHGVSGRGQEGESLFLVVNG